MKRNKFYQLAALAAPIFFFTNPVLAEEVDDDDIETIVIIANRAPTPLSQTGSSVTVLDEQAILESQKVSVLDLLRTLPGITVSRNGGIGAVSTLRIRGAESGQTMVLIDGIKVNDLSSPSGEFNFANLMTDNIERIEVLRGPQSTLYGSDAIGGVINIITKKADELFSASGSLEGGSFGTFRGSAYVGFNQDILSFTLSASGVRTGNISAADSANGNTENDPYHSHTVSGNLSVKVSDTVSFNGVLRYGDSTANFDAFDFLAGTFVDGDGVTTSQDLQGSVGVDLLAFNGTLQTNAKVSWSTIDRFDTENGGPSFSSTSRNRTVDILNTIEVSDAVTLLVGGQLQDNKITTEVFGFFASTLSGEADINSVFGEAIISPVENLTLTAGVRHDDHETFGGATTFRVTGVYHFPNAGTILRANWGEGFKAPTLFQLFSAFGDPALQPETSEGWEIGVEQELVGGNATIGVTYFHRKTQNQIDFSFVSFKFANIAQTRARGFEVVFAANPFEFMTLDANYTRVNATDLTTGLVLLRRPKNIFNANITVNPTNTISISAGVNYTGKQLDQGVFLDPFTVVDIRGSVKLAENVTLFARIENMLDENYQEVRGFGTPGISGFAGIRGNF